MAKFNNGISEAEHRLWLVLLARVISPIGLLLLGLGTDKGWGWTWPYIGLGMIGFGWGCGGDLSMAYLEDAYPEIILEGMVGVSVINNTLGYILLFICRECPAERLFVVTDRLTEHWLDVRSVTWLLAELCIISFVITVMTTAVMLYWGKKLEESTDTRWERFLVARNAIL
jgi:MFS family permease